MHRADGGYNARQIERVAAAQPPLCVEIVTRPDDSSGFIVLPRRWVVERTFSWFGRNRRLVQDYENLADPLAAFITLACTQLAIRRLARPQTFESGSKRRFLIVDWCREPTLSSFRPESLA